MTLATIILPQSKYQVNVSHQNRTLRGVKAIDTWAAEGDNPAVLLVLVGPRPFLSVVNGGVSAQLDHVRFLRS